MTAPRYPYLNPKRDLDASHPAVMIDRNRCILCGRCVRTSRCVDGKSVFGFEGRGIRTSLAINAAGGLVDTDIDPTDAAVAACPTGCLLVKRQANRIPIGQRKYDNTAIGGANSAAKDPAAGQPG
jgi:[NiFe] hydrogenase diaphorase moiety small subunit